MCDVCVCMHVCVTCVCMHACGWVWVLPVGRRVDEVETAVDTVVLDVPAVQA